MEQEPERSGFARADGAAWGALSHMLSGLLVLGLGGYGLDRWLGTHWLTLVGLLLGGAAGGYLVYIRYVKSGT